MSGHPYEDIIRLPHPASTRHHPMPNASRAAQFAPFAALTGYEEAVQETARLTEPEREMDEESLRLLNERFQEIKERIHEQPEVTLTCFVPDEQKEGGQYITLTGRIRRIDETNRQILLTDGTTIDMDTIQQAGGPF